MFVVYGIIDPRTDAIFYIGQSSDFVARKCAHLEGSDQLSGFVVKQVKLNGFLPLFVVLERVKTKAEALSAEIFWITRTLTTTVTSGVDWQAGVRGRIGVALDRTLPYIAGGLAVAQFNYAYTSFALNQTASTTTLPDETSFKDTYLGWTLGAGIEQAMTDNLILRAEYRYSDFGSKTFDTPAGQHRIDLTSKEWKIGVAYKF